MADGESRSAHRGRVDAFWGLGPDADLAASEMKQPGELYVLVPKRPGIRPVVPVKLEPVVEIRTPVILDARKTETEEWPPDAESWGLAPDTRVADAGVRALVESPSADSAVDPAAGAAPAF